VKAIVEELRATGSVLMSLHRQPDGDSVGSTLAVAMGLRRRGKRVTVASPDPVPRSYRFLPGADEIVGWAEVEGPFDTVLLLDCADPERTGAPRPLRSYGRVVVNIDHHATNRAYGDLNFVDPGASSSAELAARLLERLGVVIDRDIALALYTGIATDTGGFRYSSTTADTHRLAARLVDTGIDPGEVSEAIYEQNDPAALRVLGRALSTLRLEADGRVAVMELRRADFEGLPPGEADSLGIVNFARSIAGVEVGCLLREDEDGIKVSLRSKGRVDVGAVCQALGGGGHPRAAGATLPGPLPDARRAVLAALAKVLEPR
jgi:phosphoesterase RecJ-like protein